jgi:hypothetical protein
VVRPPPGCSTWTASSSSRPSSWVANGRPDHGHHVTGLVDLEQGRLLTWWPTRTRAAVDRWLHARTRDWLARIATVALDRWRGYAGALVAPLGHATVVVDHFRIRKLLLTAAERLTSRGRVRLRAGLCRQRPGPRPGRAGTLVPLGRRRRGGRAVEACPHRQSLGSRDPRLACHQWLFQMRSSPDPVCPPQRRGDRRDAPGGISTGTSRLPSAHRPSRATEMSTETIAAPAGTSSSVSGEPTRSRILTRTYADSHSQSGRRTRSELMG